MSDYSRYTLARTMAPPSDDLDWSALQAVPEAVPETHTAGAESIQVVVVARGDVGQPVTGTCTLQVVEIATGSDGQVLLVGASPQTGLAYGAGVSLDLKGAKTVAFRITSPTGNPASIHIYSRAVQGGVL